MRFVMERLVKLRAKNDGWGIARDYRKTPYSIVWIVNSGKRALQPEGSNTLILHTGKVALRLK